MINIKVLKKENFINQITVSGHSFYNDYGQDIVCAAISALTIGIINGLTEIAKIKEIEIIVSDGYINLKIKDNLSQENIKKSQLLLNTLFLSYQQIAEEYPNNIKLILKEN